MYLDVTCEFAQNMWRSTKYLSDVTEIWKDLIKALEGWEDVFLCLRIKPDKSIP